MTIIFDYARSGDTTAVSAALDNDPNALEEIDKESNLTLLGAAVSHGNLETTVMLLDRGANKNIRGEDDWTLLHMACYQGHEDVARMLIERGVPISAKDNQGCTPLHHASADGNESMIKLLVDHGASVDCVDNDGWTPLHLASDCGESSNYDGIIRYLVNAGASVDSVDSNGETPLHRACTKGHTHIAKVLLELNADFNKPDNYGWSGLHIAAAKGHVDILRLSKEFKGNIEQTDKNGWTPLLVASACGQVDSVNTLLDLHANINVIGSDDSTPLSVACSKGFESVVKTLVEHYAELEIQTGKDGLTALHITTGKNNRPLSEYLISKGANVNATDDHELTVLHRVAAKGLVDMVNLVLEHGANVNARAHYGSTPLDFAIDRKHEDVVEILKKAIEESNRTAQLTAQMEAMQTLGTESQDSHMSIEAVHIATSSSYSQSQISPTKSTDESTSVTTTPTRPPRPGIMNSELSDTAYKLRGINTMSPTIKSPFMPSTARSNPDKRESFASVAAAMARKRLERLKNSPHYLMSDLDAAAIASLEDEDSSSNNIDIRDTIRQAAKNAVRGNVTSSIELSPTIYSELLRVAPTVIDENNQNKEFISAEKLRRRSFARNIAFDVGRKEEYLSPEEFYEIFKLTKEDFRKLPKWKQDSKKKEANLF